VENSWPQLPYGRIQILDELIVDSIIEAAYLITVLA